MASKKPKTAKLVAERNIPVAMIGRLMEDDDLKAAVLRDEKVRRGARVEKGVEIVVDEPCAKVFKDKYPGYVR